MLPLLLAVIISRFGSVHSCHVMWQVDGTTQDSTSLLCHVCKYDDTHIGMYGVLKQSCCQARMNKDSMQTGLCRKVEFKQYLIACLTSTAMASL